MDARSAIKNVAAGRLQRAVEGSASMLRAVALCALASGGVALASAHHGSVREVLMARGVTLDSTAAPCWLDPPGLRPRRVLVLGRVGAEARDLYAVTARTSTGDGVWAVEDVSNLTRSPEADEADLSCQGRWAAFQTRVGERVAAFTLVDARGASDERDAPADTGGRLRAAITRFQQTGSPEGYGFYRYNLSPPARRARLSLGPSELGVANDDHRVTVALAGPRVLEGERWVQARPRLAGTTSWVTWLVDTVRAVPWVGPAPIAWAEHLGFQLQDRVARARVNLGPDRSQEDAAEDLADVLSGPHPQDRLEGPVEAWPPPPLRGPLSPPLAHEGEWAAAAADDPFIARNPGAPPTFFQTFVRTDRERRDTRVYITLWDPRQVELHVAPGSQEPMGATGETGSGSVPRDERSLLRLAAGFNGGFQALHGEWGVYAEGTLFLPPKPWGATIAVLSDGSTGFGSWPEAPEVPTDLLEFRQNLTSLVEDGVFNPYHRTFWGGTAPHSAPGDMHTTRTGLCTTRERHVAFFWGEDQTERTLADAMLAARCTFGLHLDMNGANTGFEFLRVSRAATTPRLGRGVLGGYQSEGNVPSAPGFVFRARRMVRAMHQGSAPRYLRRDPRDFFYLLLRPVLPGATTPGACTPAQEGEGVWHVSGLATTSFPWPLARTRLRPDAAQPERWVNLVRVDPRRVSLARPDARGTVVARFLGVSEAPQEAPGLGWDDHAGGRWTLGAQGPRLEAAPLVPGMSVLRGAGVDDNGFLVLAVADRAVPDLVLRALTLAGCQGPRLALPATAALATGGDRDAAGAPVASDAPTRFVLLEREPPGARRIFPEVHPVPMRVWYDAQHRRVRYRMGEDGNVQVNVHRGSVSMPAWGGRHPPQTPAAPTTPTPP
ncbi:MAG: hypothetical protein HY909_19270 [Deltaproteobacteria bacterium]|nr:hypothetical protein [Deltaproteobacteria bacterium]